MNKSKMTKFGFACRHKLVDECMSITELANRVCEDTGLSCDVSYLTRIWYGERHPIKIINSICKILDVTYEEEK